MDLKYKPEELLLKEYKYDGWSDTTRTSDKEEPSNTTKADETSTDLSQLPYYQMVMEKNLKKEQN